MVPPVLWRINSSRMYGGCKQRAIDYNREGGAVRPVIRGKMYQLCNPSTEARADASHATTASIHESASFFDSVTCLLVYAFRPPTRSYHSTAHLQDSTRTSHSLQQYVPSSLPSTLPCSRSIKTVPKSRGLWATGAALPVLFSIQSNQPRQYISQAHHVDGSNGEALRIK